MNNSNITADPRLKQIQDDKEISEEVVNRAIAELNQRISLSPGPTPGSIWLRDKLIVISQRLCR